VALETWRKEALQRFPELTSRIRQSSGVSDLWGYLYSACEGAYEIDPTDDNLIGRIYDYALCLSQPETENIDTNLPSATAIGFIESLPLSRVLFADLYRCLSIESFGGFENLFKYHLPPEEHSEAHRDFLKKRAKCSTIPKV
jgi:hypothetical protein